jgi:hypothetical protein
MADMPNRDGSGTFFGSDDYADNAIMFSYGMEVGSMMLGGTAKILHQNVMGTTETGFGADVGGLLNVTDNVTAGLMIRDIGSQYGDVDVPLDWRVGTAVKALDGGLTVGFDVDKVQNRDHFRINLGAEYGMEVHPSYHVFFRSGVQSADDNAFTAGLGIRVPYIQFDYSFVTERDESALGDNHRISVTARF